MVAGAFSLTRIESGLLGPIQGWLTDRYGPRLILLIGSLLFGVSFMLLAFIQNIYQFYAVFFLVAVGGSLGGFATLMVAIVHWFDRHRSKAVATSQLGFSLGGMAVPMIGIALELFGWRITAFGSGVFILLACTPASLAIRHRPEDFGDAIDGGYVGKRPTGVEREADIQSHFTARQAMRTPAFWLLSIGHALALLSVSVVMVDLLPHLTSAFGLGLVQATFLVTVMTVCQMTGQVIGGYLGDRLDKRLICSVCLLGHGFAMLILGVTTDIFMAYVFAVIQGFSWGIRAPLLVAIRADYFGASSFGTILGFSSMIMMFGMSSGPLISGFLKDATGVYTYGFIVMAALTFLGSLCFFIAKRPRPPGERGLDGGSPSQALLQTQ